MKFSVFVYPKPMCFDNVNSHFNTEDRYRHKIQNAGELYHVLRDEKLRYNHFSQNGSHKTTCSKNLFKLSQIITTRYTTIIVLLIKI